MSDRCARQAVGMCGLNPATRTSIREFCLTTCRTSRTGRSSATQFASHARSCINPRWINTVAAKSALVSNARRMSSSMSSCVTTPKPRFIRAVPAKWVMTRWLWLTARPRTRAGRPARGGCVNYAANYHRQFERHDDYDWRENSGYDSWEGSVAEEHGGIFCGK